MSRIPKEYSGGSNEDDDNSDTESDNDSGVDIDVNQNSEEEDDDDDDEDLNEDEIFGNKNTEGEEILDEVSDEDEEEEEEENDEDDQYLQKLEHHLDTNLLESAHPEIHSCNYDEMITLTRVVRDSNGRIIDPLHQTLPFLTKYEKARVIGARAEQLDCGGKPFIPVDVNIINGRTIAIMEFEQKKIPFILARPLPNGSVEYWNIQDLEIITE
jgi:DNA-directed RNA polymerase I, II, and III subunit RPABC2